MELAIKGGWYQDTLCTCKPTRCSEGLLHHSGCGVHDDASHRFISGQYPRVEFTRYGESSPSKSCSYMEATLDPAWWRALGKVLGWKEQTKPLKENQSIAFSWLYYWHIFISHLAEGENAEVFFEKLLAH